MSLMSWVNLLIILATYLVLGLVGLALYNNNESTRKTTALILTITSGLWLAIDLYNIIENQYLYKDLSSLKSWIDLLRYSVFSLITPLALLITGIAFIGSNNSRRKKALVWLLIGGLTFLFADLANLVFQFYLYSTEYRTSSTIGGDFYNTIQLVLNVLFISFSVALIIFSISGYNTLYKHSEERVVEREDTLDKWEEIKTMNVLSPMQWLGNFLLAAIPLAGPALLAVWASDHQNRIRRNWAIMQFWGITAGIGLNALLLGRVLELSDSFSGIFAVLATVFIIMIIIASILTYNYFQKKPDFEDDQNPNLGTWLANFVIVGIPVIGLIMLIVWATDSTKELIKKWATARLIWIAVSLLIWVYIYSTYTQIQQIISFTYLQF